MTHDRIPVALGDRSYRRGDRARAARPRRRRSSRRSRAGGRWRSSPTRMSRRISRRCRPRSPPPAIASEAIVLPAGRSDQELGAARSADRPAARARRRARRPCRRARRRRDRRSGRLRLLDPQARLRLRPDPDHPARAGRQLGRRQDRDQHARRQESDRRVPPARAGADRSRRARHAAAARAARRLCRGGQIRADRRFRLLRLVRGERRDAARRRSGGARTTPSRIRVAAKARIVAEDERETTGKRALLNLGHTFGHALEAETGFSDKLLHGEAVAAGMALAFAYSARRGLCAGQDAERVAAHLRAVGLPDSVAAAGITASGATLVAHMRHDKKMDARHPALPARARDRADVRRSFGRSGRRGGVSRRRA